jgi:hypothetical protein
MFRRRRFCGPSSFHHHFIAVHDAYSRTFDRGVRRSAAVRAQRPRPRMSGTAIPTIKERVGRTFTGDTDLIARVRLTIGPQTLFNKPCLQGPCSPPGPSKAPMIKDQRTQNK